MHNRSVVTYTGLAQKDKPPVTPAADVASPVQLYIFGMREVTHTAMCRTDKLHTVATTAITAQHCPRATVKRLHLLCS